MAVTLQDVAREAGGRLQGADDAASIVIADITLDSRTVGERTVFAALPGTRTHGAHFAMDTPAAAVLTDVEGQRILHEAGDSRPVVVVDEVRATLGRAAAVVYGNPSAELTVIGITGTSGKTTTSYLLERGLMSAGLRVGLIGTTGTRIDGKPVPTQLTTPEAPTLQKLFATMVARGVTHVVMEVSSHALALRRVLGVDFAVAGFSNLSQDHLDFHPTMEDYFSTKALLFCKDSPMAARSAVVCIDDAWGARMARIAGKHGPVRTVATPTSGNLADYQASELSVADTGEQRFQLSGPGLVGEHAGEWVSIRLPGRFNVANAALAVALAEQLPEASRPGFRAAFLAGMAEAAVPGRMEPIDHPDLTAVVDYAHKPAAVAEVLDALRAQTSRRVGVVLGAGGDRDHGKRPIMGEAAASRADLVIVTDDNPRDEDPASIRAAVLAGAEEAQDSAGGRRAEIREVADRAEAIRQLVAWAQPGDSIAVVGKGHETGQLVRGVTHHFDDREELRAALAATREAKEQR